MGFEPTRAADSALGRILEPHSVAVIGASSNPGKRGYQIVKALKRSGYKHKIYPVNPRGGTVLGLPVSTTLEFLPEAVDVAVIARPAAEVPQILRDCGRRGIAGAVVLANGFREKGELGVRLEEELLLAVQSSGVRVIGPNTSGMLNCGLCADLVGLPEVPPHGPISVLAQSGNMILSVTEDNAAINGPGFDLIVGLGNQADVGHDELIDELARRPSTRSIALYCEGFRNGRVVIESARRAARSCAIVLLRGGRSAVGQQTALSHTGSIAGSDEIGTRVFRQAGITLVDRSDELTPVAAVLATSPLPKPETGVVVVSDGGGHATLAADALSKAGISFAALSNRTKTALCKLLGPDATVDNPVDVASAADAYPQVFPECVDILSDDPQVGLILINGLYGGYHIRFDPSLREDEDAAAARLAKIAKSKQTAVIVQSCYARRKPRNHDILRTGGIQVLSSIDHSIAAARALMERSAWLAKPVVPTVGKVREPTVPLPSGLLQESAARRVLSSIGVETGPWVAASSASEVEKAVTQLGALCAVKLDSRDVVHKSDVGGVRLNVTPESAQEACTSIVEAVAAHSSKACTYRFIVTPMVSNGIELFIGIKNDPVFGLVVLFGTGGILVEVMNDVTFRSAPLPLSEVESMIEETRVARLLDGYRGYPKVDKRAMARFIVTLADATTDLANFQELDINPLIVNEHGVHPVDIRLIGASPDAWSNNSNGQ